MMLGREGNWKVHDFPSSGRGFDSHRPLHKSLLMQLALLASHLEKEVLQELCNHVLVSGVVERDFEGEFQHVLTEKGHPRRAVRVGYSANKSPGQWKAHGRYVARESATQGGKAPEAGFNAKQRLNIATILDKWQSTRDERLFKIIVPSLVTA
jgi:hypothetical protein